MERSTAEVKTLRKYPPLKPLGKQQSAGCSQDILYFKGSNSMHYRYGRNGYFDRWVCTEVNLQVEHLSLVCLINMRFIMSWTCWSLSISWLVVSGLAYQVVQLMKPPPNHFVTTRRVSPPCHKMHVEAWFSFLLSQFIEWLDTKSCETRWIHGMVAWHFRAGTLHMMVGDLYPLNHRQPRPMTAFRHFPHNYDAPVVVFAQQHWQINCPPTSCLSFGDVWIAFLQGVVFSVLNGNFFGTLWKRVWHEYHREKNGPEELQ